MSGSNGGPGRPPGVKNGQGTSIAPIKNWKPKHEKIVQLSLLQYKNKEIAEIMGLSEVRISQILNDPKAVEVKKETVKLIRKNTVENIEDGLIDLAALSVDRLRETIETPFVPGSDAKKHQDNVALKLAQGFIPMSEENRNANSGGLSTGLAERIANALERSNEAKKLHGTPVEEEDDVVDDPDYSIED